MQVIRPKACICTITYPGALNDDRALRQKSSGYLQVFYNCLLEIYQINGSRNADDFRLTTRPGNTQVPPFQMTAGNFSNIQQRKCRALKLTADTYGSQTTRRLIGSGGQSYSYKVTPLRN
jgi:hypothetical protein